MSCCVSFFRWIVENLLLVFNIVFVLAGIVALSLGIVFCVNLSDYSGYFEDTYYAAPILIIVIGSVTLVLAGLGCCGSCYDNRCMLKTYMWLLVVVLMGVIVVIGVAFYYGQTSKIQSIISKNLVQDFNDYNKYESKIDDLQKELQCCGINSATDYNNRSLPFPTSCCSDSTIQCNPENAYSEGCLDALTNILTSISNGVGIFAVIVALILLTCIFCVCCIESTRKTVLTTV